MRPDRWSLPMLLVLAAIVLGAGLGLREPMPPDEPRFALMARDMVETGDWLFPRRGDELYAHKPPTFMWLQAAAYAATGSLRIAFLLPSLLASLLTLALVWDLARRLWNRRAANWAALALLTSIQFALQARRGQIDAVVVTMITAAMYGFIRHYLLGGRPAWAILGWSMAGLGTITKGVGFLPLLALPVTAWVRRAGWRHVAPAEGRSLGMLGPLAFIATAGVWLGPMLVRAITSGDPAIEAYVHDLLFRQTAVRYSNPWHHHQPPWYFLPVIASLWLPFALALPGLMPAWWRRMTYRHDTRFLVLVGWSLLVLVFFSLSPGKRDVYILPALPMLCVAAGPLLPGLARKRWLRTMLASFIALIAAVALCAGVHSWWGEPDWVRSLLAARGMTALPSIVPDALIALGTAGLALVVVCRLKRAAPATLMFMALLWLLYGLALMPALSDASSARALMARVGEQIGPKGELALLAWREQHLLQADRPATTFGFERSLHEQWPDALRWLQAAPERRWLFLQDDALPACVDPGATIDVGTANRRRFLLLPASALDGACGLNDIT